MYKHLTNYNDGWMGLIGQQGKKKKDKAEELIQEVDENSRKGGDQG